MKDKNATEKERRSGERKGDKTTVKFSPQRHRDTENNLKDNLYNK
jgi:hypothetical protein